VWRRGCLKIPGLYGKPQPATCTSPHFPNVYLHFQKLKSIVLSPLGLQLPFPSTNLQNSLSFSHVSNSNSTMTSPVLKKYPGNCHCGAFKFHLLIPELISVTECNCSICFKKGYKWIYPPPGRFVVEKGEGDLREYGFGKGEIVHKVYLNLRLKRERWRWRWLMREYGE
jgi:hypothetical protein